MIALVAFKFYRLKLISSNKKLQQYITPPSKCKSYFGTNLIKVLGKCRSNFGNIVFLGDFNMEPTKQKMTTFMTDDDFINIIKSSTCFQTSTTTFIDLILTN